VTKTVSCWPLTAKVRIGSGSVRVRFVADKVEVVKVSLRVLRFCSVNIISLLFSILIYHLGDEEQSRW
jgi:hypothetical protein